MAGSSSSSRSSGVGSNSSQCQLCNEVRRLEAGEAVAAAEAGRQRGSEAARQAAIVPFQSTSVTDFKETFVDNTNKCQTQRQVEVAGGARRGTTTTTMSPEGANGAR